MARGGQSDRFFLQKRHFIYKLSVKRQKTGQKTAKKPPKNLFFQLLRLSVWVWPQMLRNASGQTWNVAQRLRLDLKCCATFQAKPGMLRNVSGQTRNFVQRFRLNLECCASFQAWPEMLRNVSGQTHTDSWRGWKKQVFGRFLPVFCPVLCMLSIYAHIIWIFWKEISPW